jgi:hypothetical protein
MTAPTIGQALDLLRRVSVILDEKGLLETADEIDALKAELKHLDPAAPLSSLVVLHPGQHVVEGDKLPTSFDAYDATHFAGTYSLVASNPQERTP